MESDLHETLPSGETVVCPATTTLERDGEEIATVQTDIDASAVWK